jgi:hypothetical protein
MHIRSIELDLVLDPCKTERDYAQTTESARSGLSNSLRKLVPFAWYGGGSVDCFYHSQSGGFSHCLRVCLDLQRPASLQPEVLTDFVGWVDDGLRAKTPPTAVLPANGLRTGWVRSNDLQYLTDWLFHTGWETTSPEFALLMAVDDRASAPSRSEQERHAEAIRAQGGRYEACTKSWSHPSAHRGDAPCTALIFAFAPPFTPATEQLVMNRVRNLTAKLYRPEPLDFARVGTAGRAPVVQVRYPLSDGRYALSSNALLPSTWRKG